MNRTIFVYGSLRQGRPNHEQLVDVRTGTARFEGLAQTRVPYPLVLEPNFWSPPMLLAAGYGHQVVGEVWTVSGEKFGHLNEFEGAPTFFTPHQIMVQFTTNPDGSPIERFRISEAVSFVFRHFNPDRLRLGGYECHPEYTEEMARRYVPVGQRPPNHRQIYLASMQAFTAYRAC